MTKEIADQGKNSEVIQLQNRLLVLRLIRERKVISRVMLAELTGLKQATITNIVNELIKMEYIKETGLIEGNNGRRVKGIELNVEKMRVLIVRFTSEYYAVGVYDLNGKCLRVEKKFWEKDSSFQERLEIMKEEILPYKEKLSRKKQILGVGIVLQSGLVGASPELYNVLNGDMETYVDRYFSEMLQMDVFVDNYSNMSAFYEWNCLTSENKKIHTLVSLTVGYSVDCAVILDGMTLQGRNGKVSHFGHVSIDMNGQKCECGNRGCINQYVSISAIRKRISELKGKYPEAVIDENSNIRDIIKAYYSNEPLALELYEETAGYLGIIIANLINQFNPEEIIFGDEIPNSDEFLELVKHYTRMRLPWHRFARTNLKMFKAERKTEMDVGMKGMCLYVINEGLKHMKLK